VRTIFALDLVTNTIEKLKTDDIYKELRSHSILVKTEFVLKSKKKYMIVSNVM